MNRLLTAAVLSSCLLAATAFAQDEEGEEVEMNMNVDMGGMDMGMGAGVKVKVKQTTRTTTTVTTTDEEEAPAPAMRRHHKGGRAPAPAPMVRDCGLPGDPGCGMARNGNWAMDAQTFNGFLSALKANPNEISRSEICEKMFQSHYLTAAQLGLVLDLFVNEITRLEVAQFAAPKVVNPSHALGHAAKWKNSISGQEYTELMAGQN